jgi:hypothetical protein
MRLIADGLTFKDSSAQLTSRRFRAQELALQVVIAYLLSSQGDEEFSGH